MDHIYLFFLQDLRKGILRLKSLSIIKYGAVKGATKHTLHLLHGSIKQAENQPLDISHDAYTRPQDGKHELHI